MGPDEREIHEVHSTWIDAVNAGDLVRLLTLMADDGIPQTARRPLAPGPRCPHVVPGGEVRS